MPPFRWTLMDDEGQQLRSSEDFGTKEEAEAWMSAHWAELLEEGAGSVRLSRLRTRASNRRGSTGFAR